MRLDIFKWIEKEFGEFKGVINYVENVNDVLNRRDNKLYVITEIKFSVGVTDARDDLLSMETHRRWKEELNVLSDFPCDGCRIKFEADKSCRNKTPDAVNIAKGVKPDDLIERKSFVLTVNIFKKVPFTEN